MPRSKNTKFVTFETSNEIWCALKTRAYSQEKTVKQFLNELLTKILKTDKARGEIGERKG